MQCKRCLQNQVSLAPRWLIILLLLSLLMLFGCSTKPARVELPKYLHPNPDLLLEPTVSSTELDFRDTKAVIEDYFLVVEERNSIAAQYRELIEWHKQRASEEK